MSQEAGIQSFGQCNTSAFAPDLALDHGVAEELVLPIRMGPEANSDVPAAPLPPSYAVSILGNGQTAERRHCQNNAVEPPLV